MIFPEALLDIIITKSRTENYDINRIVNWINNFNTIMHDLMIVDYLIQKECTGQECLKSCSHTQTKIQQNSTCIHLIRNKWEFNELFKLLFTNTKF